MKKLLIASAALAMVAGSAVAQSSVTVYGRLDAGYKDYSTTTAGVKTSTQNISNSAFTTSRLGFMGTEDLGGGIKANFMIEGALQTSAGSNGSNDPTGFNTGRQQWVSLSSANAGILMIGKTDSLVKGVFDNFDAGFSNNLVGAYDGFGTGADFASATSNPANIIGNQRDVVARYTSPKFSGFDVTVGFLKQSSDSTVAAAATETGTGYELGSTYTAGALALAAGYRSADTKANGTPATTGTAGFCSTNAGGGALVAVAAGSACAAPAVRVSGADVVAAVPATDSTTNSTALGASYNFGPVVGFVQYFDQDIKNNVAGTKVAEDAYAVGVRVPVGKATLFASYTDGERTAGATKTDMTGTQVGVKYDFSKRTYAYAAYGESDKQVAGGVKQKAENLAFGVTHSF